MPQAFKGSITAMEAADAMTEGVLRAAPRAEPRPVPMADGGDDTLDVLVDATGGAYHTTQVRGPAGLPVDARWGVLGDGETAVIEMAQASGIRLLKPSERDPRTATTVGTGQLMRAVMKNGYRKVIVGIGGSATVDGGTGAAKALGVHFRDIRGRELHDGGADLINLHTIGMTHLDPRVAQTSITVACDVDMPLCGPRGAWRFAAQKGATPAVAEELAMALERFAQVIDSSLGVQLASMPLAGPGGGLSGGLHAFLGADLLPGPEVVLAITAADKQLSEADLIIVGEGRIDAGTFWGKGPGTIIRLAGEASVPVLAVAGQLGEDAPDLHALGVRDAETLMIGAASEADAIARARELIVAATEEVVRRFLERSPSMRDASRSRPSQETLTSPDIAPGNPLPEPAPVQDSHGN